MRQSVGFGNSLFWLAHPNSGIWWVWFAEKKHGLQNSVESFPGRHLAEFVSGGGKTSCSLSSTCTHIYRSLYRSINDCCANYSCICSNMPFRCQPSKLVKSFFSFHGKAFNEYLAYSYVLLLDSIWRFSLCRKIPCFDIIVDNGVLPSSVSSDQIDDQLVLALFEILRQKKGPWKHYEVIMCLN